MKLTAYHRGWLWLPYEAVIDLDRMRKHLTFQPRKKMDGTIPDPVLMYYDDPTRRLIAVPQAWGLENFDKNITVVDQTTDGEAMVNPGSLPTPRDAKQEQFMNDMLAAMNNEKIFIASAPTGTGKTVVSLWAACQRKRKTLILVHLERLKAQWIREIHDKLGVPMESIGEVQGDKVQWEGKDYVVAMMPTIAYKPLRYPGAFYRSFGTIIIDEVHRAGAPMFSQSIWQFPARVRMGMTATPKRKDGAERIIYYHLGKIAVTSDQEAMPLEVWPIWYESTSDIWGDSHGARILCLSRDYRRNQRLVKLIGRLYDSGRQSIIVAEGVAHLQLLIKMCEQAGIPKGVMGQFTAHVKEVKEVRAGDRMQKIQKNRKQKASELERILRESQLTFATYGMIKEGIDVPRWDSGIDATPRSDATQLIGRIRRPFEGKKDPVLWITMVDSKCSRSLRYYQQRLPEYQSAGATVMDRS